VFRAEQAAAARRVALKLFTADESARWDDNEFKRETQALIALHRHPNLLSMYDAGTTPDGRRYVAFANLAGSLRSVSRVRRLSFDEVARVGTDIANALTVIHQARVVHRDITPDNVRVTDDGRSLLGALGSAAPLLEPRPSLMATDDTAQYLAPEVVAGESPDHRSDIYSLGLTLYELATAVSPFASIDGESADTLRARIRHDQPADARSFGVPDWLATIIDRAMSKDPFGRYRSAEDMADDLDVKRSTASLVTAGTVGATGTAALASSADAHEDVVVDGDQHHEASGNAAHLEIDATVVNEVTAHEPTKVVRITRTEATQPSTQTASVEHSRSRGLAALWL
jgi:serine/threonine protein kinase